MYVLRCCTANAYYFHIIIAHKCILWQYVHNFTQRMSWICYASYELWIRHHPCQSSMADIAIYIISNPTFLIVCLITNIRNFNPSGVGPVYFTRIELGFLRHIATMLSLPKRLRKWSIKNHKTYRHFPSASKKAILGMKMMRPTKLCWLNMYWCQLRWFIRHRSKWHDY